MTYHTIVLDNADEREASYGITHKSVYVYPTSKGHAPTRIVVWDNTNRPFDGSRVDVRGRVVDGEWVADKGKYLDPHNRATDNPVTVLLTPESSAICLDTRYNTGQPGSGQVYAATDTRISEGDTLTLVYPEQEDGALVTRDVTVSFKRHGNGHGEATFK
jgi:hypothetical protein